MSILVTGDAGFVGASLKAALEALGHRVTGFDRQRGEQLDDLASLERAVSTADVVYHVAAQADLTTMAGSLDAARQGVADNVEATHNVAYACAKHGVWVIYISTLCVYGAATDRLSTEEHTLPHPPEIYACSKYAGEAIVQGYGRNFDMPWTILRIATVYGPGMRASLGLHIFFRQAMSGVPVTLHGDGSQVRALTFIDDLTAGMASPVQHAASAKGQIINLANGLVISARKMAEDVVRITGSRSSIVSIPQRRHQIMHENVDTAKARDLLNWTADTPWPTGLSKTHLWMMNAS